MEVHVCEWVVWWNLTAYVSVWSLCLCPNRATLLNKLIDGWNAGIKAGLILQLGIEKEREREGKKRNVQIVYNETVDRAR